jgi:hypothetical protein
MRRILFASLLIALVAVELPAQRNRGGSFGGGGRCSFGNWDGEYFVSPSHNRGNIPYDGRFTFTRVQYAGIFRCGDEGPGWAHDYPVAEQNFMKILRELTLVRPHMERFNILRLDSPEIFKYPALYFSEPGGWLNVTEAEIKGMRDYLAKGGFVIFDDFESLRGSTDDYSAFLYQMRRVIPDVVVMPLPPDHHIFDTFFHITEPWKSGTQNNGEPEFYAIFEDNDPSKRALAVLNYKNDLGENWQYSATGTIPIDRTNESYKLGINYYIYAMTR